MPIGAYVTLLKGTLAFRLIWRIDLNCHVFDAKSIVEQHAQLFQGRLVFMAGQ
jgi:hypothetical protein